MLAAPSCRSRPLDLAISLLAADIYSSHTLHHILLLRSRRLFLRGWEGGKWVIPRCRIWRQFGFHHPALSDYIRISSIPVDELMSMLTHCCSDLTMGCGPVTAAPLLAALPGNRCRWQSLVPAHHHHIRHGRRNHRYYQQIAAAIA